MVRGVGVGVEADRAIVRHEEGWLLCMSYLYIKFEMTRGTRS
jgi:hypothetical protein